MGLKNKQERKRKLWTGKLEGDLSLTLSNFVFTNSVWRQTHRMAAILPPPSMSNFK